MFIVLLYKYYNPDSLLTSIRSSIEECKARGTYAGPGNIPQQRRETQLYDLIQTEFKSKDGNGRIRKFFVVDFISSMVNGNTYVVKYDGKEEEERVDEDEMLNLYDARV